MVLLIGAALAVLSIAILAYPFFRGRLRPQAEDSRDGTGDDAPGVESIYQKMGTLQLEYQLGKVPEDVYRELLRTYRLQAAVVLRQQDQARDSAIFDQSSGKDIRADGEGDAP